jgi:type IV secretory pathway TrbL component
MSNQRKQLAIVGFILWLLLVLFFMILAQTLNIEIFFVLWLLGLLIIVEFIGPSYVRPRYFRYLKYLITAGIIVFGAIVAQKAMEILNS